jgi:hypothetical protein
MPAFRTTRDNDMTAELSALKAACDIAKSALDDAVTALVQLEIQHAKSQADVWQRIADQRTRFHATRHAEEPERFEDMQALMEKNDALFTALRAVEREQKLLTATFTIAHDAPAERLFEAQCVYSDKRKAFNDATEDDDDEPPPEEKKW